jgi:hypothetical protein
MTDTTSELEVRLRAALAPSYQLIRPLGKGGMGTVFLAREPSLKRLVAVKVLSPELAQDEEAHIRFEREAQSVAALAHPGVVGIYGVGQLPDRTPYFVMQYVAGRSLAERIEADGALPIAEARRIVAEVASALAAAHAKGIIHRDIKPANVLQDEASGRVLVSDFGLAAVEAPSTEQADIRLTQTGMRVGTPQYMSPEQLIAEQVTERTDIYALGLLAYELVTGKGPFAASTPGELIAAHLRDVPPRLMAKRADADPELDALVAACLEKDPNKRPSAQDIADRLAPRGVGVLEWPPPGLEEFQGIAGPHGRWLWWTGGMVAISLAAFLALGTRMVDARNSGFGILLIAGILLGGIGMLVRLRLLLADVNAASLAVRAGYAWRTVLEVACDPRGDTGAVISGSRNFASMSSAARATLRAGRIAAGALGVVAPIVAPGLSLVWLFAATRMGWTPPVVALLLVAPLVVAEAVRIAVWLMEHSRSGLVAQVKQTSRELDGLALAWYSSAMRSTGQTPVPQSRRPYLGRLLTATSIVVGVVTIVLVAPLLLVPYQGAWLAEVASNDATSTLQRLRVTMAYSRVAPTVDPSISPLTAGRNLYQALDLTRLGPPRESYPRNAASGHASLPSLDTMPLLFAGQTHLGLPHHELVWRRARGGMASEEREWLEEFATHPIWALVDTVAKAAEVDALGGEFVQPFPDSAQFASLPLPAQQAVRLIVHGNVSRAAYYASIGQSDSARAILQRGMGFARAFATTAGAYSIHTSYALVRITEAAIAAHDSVFGNPDAERLRAIRDSLRIGEDAFVASSANAVRQGVGAAAVRAQALRSLRNQQLPASSRFEQLFSVSMTQCTSLSEVLFGPSPELRAAFLYARDSVARFESERRVVEMITRAPDGFADSQWAERGAPIQIVGRMMHFTGRLLGSRRVQGCAQLLGDRQRQD